jgi:hypothetical protein
MKEEFSKWEAASAADSADARVSLVYGPAEMANP